MLLVEKNALPMFKGQIEILDAKTQEPILRRENLVVAQSKTIAVRAITGIDPAAFAVKQIALGSGTTPPTDTDTALENELLRVEITTVSFPDESTVIFEAYMDYDVGNGNTFTEVGLVTPPSQLYPNGLLFARALIDPPFTKTETFAYTIRWKISAV
jgi:hypothetical protein